MGMLEKIKINFFKAILKLERISILKLNDNLFLKLNFYVKMGKKLNLKNPKTFNEKLQWLKLYDKNPLYTNLVDKFSVREHITKNCGEDCLIPLIGVYDSFDDIDFSKLPNQFVMKCTHDSGGLVICKNKNNFDIKKAKEKIIRSLEYNYFYHSREWPYKNITPKIIIEQYMEDEMTKELIDYKIMCFNGEPKLLFTCTDRFSKSGLKVTFFDLNWNKLPFKRKYDNSTKRIKKPKNFEKMLDLSKKLSHDIPFVRVDWYEINGNLYFGEMTFYPGSGCEKFEPIEWDYKLGEMLQLYGNKVKK